MRYLFRAPDTEYTETLRSQLWMLNCSMYFLHSDSQFGGNQVHSGWKRLSALNDCLMIPTSTIRSMTD